MLIEYAAFYGSIQIFKYLVFNGALLNPNLWEYAIHSDNAEMIHLLIENNVGPVLRSFSKCLEVAIKCNHNDIANYIFDNLLSDENRLKYTEQSFQDNIYSYCFKYQNFGFDHLDIDNKFIFFFLCQYNYLNLVKLFVKHKKIDINDKVEISNFFLLNII